MIAGYLHANYAQAFKHLGEPHYLPRSQGWIIKRPIPGVSYQDAMGCYPIFACRHWRSLGGDLEKLKGELVSLTLVTDPFGEFELMDLRSAFPDLVRPYKEHFVVSLDRPLKEIVCSHHQRNARKALSHLTVERCTSATAFDEWITLYAHLIRRHAIAGVATFSRESFARQWQVPGLVIFRAAAQGETVGMTLWYRSEDRAYYHLAAYSPRGYQLKASFALFWRALEFFSSEGLRWAALGAGAGLENDGTDGLARFKRGWATESRTVYLCGRIFDHQLYTALSGTSAVNTSPFFPAYRQIDFGGVAAFGSGAV